jgi:4'-phosphopantetheinyl transferase
MVLSAMVHHRCQVAPGLHVAWAAVAHRARALEALLDDDERAAWHALPPGEPRNSYAAAHGLLRLELSRQTGRAPRDWRFAPDPFGKPALRRAPGLPPLAFNLSHTRGLVACVVSDGARYRVVGVDVEVVRATARLPALAARYFSRAEQGELAALPAAERPARFFALWTLKEAWAKARGYGLAAPFDRVSFMLDPSGASARVSFAAGFPDAADGWRFELRALDGGHVLALAAAA